MNNLNLLLWLFAGMLLLVACNGKGRAEGSFTEEELAWLVYADGDNLLYQNHDSVGDEVTLFAAVQTQPTQLRNYYPIETEVVLGNPEQGDYFKIYLLKDERDFKRYLKFGDVYRSFDPIEPMSELKVGDIVYKEVYLFQEDSTDRSSSQIGEVYYAKGFGVVQYSTQDGRVFQLFNNELTQQ